MYAVVYIAIPQVIKGNCIDCICIQMYCETWKCICFWGAHSLRSLAHIHVHFFSVGTFGGLAPPPPHTKKLATLLRRGNGWGTQARHNTPSDSVRRSNCVFAGDWIFFSVSIYLVGCLPPPPPQKKKLATPLPKYSYRVSATTYTVYHLNIDEILKSFP